MNQKSEKKKDRDETKVVFLLRLQQRFIPLSIPLRLLTLPA
jgi:hypothetical protein